ncbi:PREDICTED: DNA repair protein XRCC1 [Ficedula albicollis]|uniref:X-ray repair cross complementing 1 n=1 Tax=Ficedula albicollis TaxID=59894 RepID=U3JUX2_FICAL|nr:PREDICTED: DNA repair protein XRCC1 [Ficedula albicollis]
MAPIKISYVVSFSSQDPKYPAENLLSEDGIRPWLGCPKKRSRQLSVELQLERASPIGYVDIGNYGCAFLQIEVGRSSWTRDQPYLTLVPTVTLMTPADSKLDQNRYGVRMFKEADFSELTVGQKWDRVRLTCSQPFSPCSRFGLSFIRLRTPQEQEPDPPRPPLDAEDAELSDRPRCSSPAFHQTSFPEPCLRSREEEQLRSCLGKLEGAAWSRSARMVLLAAQNQALRPRAGTSTLEAHLEPLNKDGGGPAVPGSSLDVPAVLPSTCRQLDRHCAPSPVGRAPAATSRTPRVKGRARGPRERRVRRSDRGQASSDRETGVCPICSGCFLLDLLPTHASQCGEDPTAAWPFLSPDASFLSPDAWVSCPICQLPFSVAEVEQHASNCGETPGALYSPQGLQ